MIKRGYDILLALVACVVLAPIMAIGWGLAVVDTRSSGIFRQPRCGYRGVLFNIVKLRTMRESNQNSSVTVRGSPSISRVGAILRRTKIDEMPQLVNVLAGHMSLVGPRPDTPDMIDRVRAIADPLFASRPGITGPASLKWRHEEGVLSEVADPIRFSSDLILPDKIRMQVKYLHEQSVIYDSKCMLWTLFPLCVPDDLRAVVSADDPRIRSGLPQSRDERNPG